MVYAQRWCICWEFCVLAREKDQLSDAGIPTLSRCFEPGTAVGKSVARRDLDAPRRRDRLGLPRTRPTGDPAPGDPLRRLLQTAELIQRALLRPGGRRITGLQVHLRPAPARPRPSLIGYQDRTKSITDSAAVATEAIHTALANGRATRR